MAENAPKPTEPVETKWSSLEMRIYEGMSEGEY